MSILNWILTVIVIVLVILPPKWDPAIRFKEWMNAKNKDR